MTEIKPDGSVHSAPVVNIDSVTPHDSNEVTMNPLSNGMQYPRGFMVNVAGDVKLTDLDDTAVTLTVLAGIIYPICFKVMWSTGTTATGIHALA